MAAPTVPPGRDPLGRDEDDELAAFITEQKKRHHRLLAAVIAGSVLLLGAGVVCLWIAKTDQRIGYVAGGLFMTGLGLLGLIRAAISLLTDIDTRDRGEWDDLIGHGDER